MADAGVSDIDPAVRLRWLQKLAADLPSGGVINMTLCWEGPHGPAGVYSYPNESWVFLFNAQKSVESLAEAIHLLGAIFANDVVAVSAYAEDQLVYTGLRPRADVSGGFNLLDTPSAGDMPRIDWVTVESWSRGMEEE